MKPDSLPASAEWLAGSGEMGKLIRSVDWSASSLGPVEGWPQSLRTTLSLILNAKFPLLLFWGTELICFYNEAYQSSLGSMGNHPAVGQRGELIWPELWSAIKPRIDQVLAGGGATWSQDQRLPTSRSGRLEDEYWTLSYSPVSDESGRPGGVLVTGMETTEKTHTIRSLLETQDQLKSAIDAAELGTWDMNPVTRQLVANARLKEWYGLPDHSNIPLSVLFDAIVPTDRLRIRQAVETALHPASDGRYEAVYTIHHPQTGQERMVRAKGRAYFNETGTVYRFAGTTQDITGQVLAREQVRRAEQLAQLAVAGAGAGTFFVDLADSNHIVYSPALAVIFAGHEITGMTRAMLLTYIVPEDRPVREKAYQEAARTGKLNYEARTVWHDGTTHWVRVFGTYLFDTNGVATGFSGIAMDITAQSMAQQELERQVQERTRELSEANQTLLRTNRELEQFAYIASHDLQEPLRKIQSFADLLQTSRHDNQLADLYLGKIIKSAQRMSELIKAVLGYSRLAAKTDLFEKTDLSQIVQAVLTDFDLLIEQKRAVIRYDALPILTGIPLQLSQLFTNLIGNALKFTDKNPCITITSALLSPDDPMRPLALHPALPYVYIAVHDNGIGFDQQYADRIFSLFQRLSNGKAYGGTGIGLALCKKIVENHHGVITAESALNQGATFHIYLVGR